MNRQQQFKKVCSAVGLTWGHRERIGLKLSSVQDLQLTVGRTVQLDVRLENSAYVRYEKRDETWVEVPRLPNKHSNSKDQ